MQPECLISIVFGLAGLLGFGLGVIVRALILRRRQQVEMAGWNEIAAIVHLTPPERNKKGRPTAFQQAKEMTEATLRQPKRRYKKRIRMPSKLDPHLATIESWLAKEPQITALAIVHRLAAIDPATFSERQHSIVQRRIRSLRRKGRETLIVAMAAQASNAAGGRPVPVDGASFDGHSAPPTGPLSKSQDDWSGVSVQAITNQSRFG